MLGDHGNEDFILIKLPRCHKYMCTSGKDGAQCYASLHCDEHGHLRTLAGNSLYRIESCSRVVITFQKMNNKIMLKMLRM